MSFTEDLRGEMMVAPAKKLEDLIHLAELCVDLLQQNEEHYAEVSQPIQYVNETLLMYQKKNIKLCVFTTNFFPSFFLSFFFVCISTKNKHKK